MLRHAFLVLGALSMAASVPHATAADAVSHRTLTDFSSGSADLGWTVVNDDVMGGRSRGGFETEAGSLRFAGRTNTNGGGFSSIRTKALSLDLSAYDGVRVRVRADGRRYTWRITTDARWRGRTVSYWADFQTTRGEWTTVDIPFARFEPQFRGMALDGPRLDTSRIRGMGLMIYDKRDGPFELELDRVEAYAARSAFSLAQHRGKHRVLVLGAPAAGDAQVLRQLARIEASRGAFEERDLVLVVVLEDGASLAGDRALTSGEAAEVRRAVGANTGSFSLRLVGKDGGVKRVSNVPVAMQDLYDLIDSMPMRQAEMRERVER